MTLRILNRTPMDKTEAKTTMLTPRMCCVLLPTVSGLEAHSHSCSKVLLTTKRLSRAMSGQTCHPQTLIRISCWEKVWWQRCRSWQESWTEFLLKKQKWWRNSASLTSAKKEESRSAKVVMLPSASQVKQWWLIWVLPLRSRPSVSQMSKPP